MNNNIINILILTGVVFVSILFLGLIVIFFLESRYRRNNYLNFVTKERVKSIELERDLSSKYVGEAFNIITESKSASICNLIELSTKIKLILCEESEVNKKIIKKIDECDELLLKSNPRSKKRKVKKEIEKIIELLKVRETDELGIVKSESEKCKQLKKNNILSEKNINICICLATLSGIILSILLMVNILEIKMFIGIIIIMSLTIILLYGMKEKIKGTSWKIRV